MGQAKLQSISLSDYRAIEQENHQRYEFHEGTLYAMAGGTVVHSTICNNVASELRGLTKRAGNCVSFNSEMKIEIVPGGKYVYPDAGLACPKLRESKQLTGAINNPKLIVEVASPQSLPFDVGQKQKWYFSLPSLYEYLVILQDRAEVLVWQRRKDLYKYVSYSGLDTIITLESIEGQLSLAEIYENVDLPKPADKGQLET